MRYQLFVLIDTRTGDFQKYPFIATADDKIHRLHIATNHTIYFEGPDHCFSEADYMDTNRVITLDTKLIDSLVRKYIGEKSFELITCLDTNPHITMYAQTFPLGTTKSVSIFPGNKQENAAYLCDKVIAMMRKVMEMVNLPD